MPARPRQHDDDRDTMTTPARPNAPLSALYVVTESDAFNII